MYGGEVLDTKTVVVKSKLSEKKTTKIVRTYTILKTPDLVSQSRFMRVNEKYAHSPEPICPEEHTKEVILGATGT